MMGFYTNVVVLSALPHPSLSKFEHPIGQISFVLRNSFPLSLALNFHLCLYTISMVLSIPIFNKQQAARTAANPTGVLGIVKIVQHRFKSHDSVSKELIQTVYFTRDMYPP